MKQKKGTYVQYSTVRTVQYSTLFYHTEDYTLSRVDRFSRLEYSRGKNKSVEKCDFGKICLLESFPTTYNVLYRVCIVYVSFGLGTLFVGCGVIEVGKSNSPGGVPSIVSRVSKSILTCSSATIPFRDCYTAFSACLRCLLNGGCGGGGHHTLRGFCVLV